MGSESIQKDYPNFDLLHAPLVSIFDPGVPLPSAQCTAYSVRVQSCVMCCTIRVLRSAQTVRVHVPVECTRYDL